MGEATTLAPVNRNIVPRRPGSRAAASIAQLAVWLAHTFPPPDQWQVIKFCKENFEISSTRQAKNLLVHARALLRTTHGRAITDMRAESINRVEAVCKDPATPPLVRIKWETRLAYLLGLDAPRQVELAVAHVDAQHSIRKLDYAAIANVQQQVLGIQQAQQHVIDTPSEVKQLPAVNIPEEDKAPNSNVTT